MIITRFADVWKLVSSEYRTAKGRISYSHGRNPVGIRAECPYKLCALTVRYLLQAASERVLLGKSGTHLMVILHTSADMKLMRKKE